MFTSLRMDNVLQSALNLVRKNCKSESFIKEKVQELMQTNAGELFAISYGSSMTTNDVIARPNEKDILNLLINYLFLKIEDREEVDGFKKVFTILDNHRVKLKVVFEILKQWLVDLTVVNCIKDSAKPEKGVKNYAIVLQERLRNLEGTCILPSGFERVTFNGFSFPHRSLLEKEYKGPHSTASIVESESKQFKRLIQIDPVSAYQRSFRELTADKISLGLEIDKIPSINFDVNFLFALMTLRIIRGDNNYESAHLYEVVLSKLSGKGNLRNKKEFFINMEEKGFFSLSWTLVKHVFYYLLKKSFDNQEVYSLYVKIICEFQFKLLINIFDEYKRLGASDKLNREKYQFLLNEMCNKVAYDAANCQDIKQKIIDDYILIVQQSITHNNQRFYDEMGKEKNIKEITFRHNNFQKCLPTNLKGLNFIRASISNDLASSLNSTVRKQFSFHTLNFEKDKNNVQIVNFNRLLDELTEYYGFNRVIQISQLIEYFVFSIVQPSGFKNWCSDENSYVQSARILLRSAYLYYNCSAVIFSHLYPDESSSYEPTYYTKLVLILFSLFVMIEDLVRNDKKIGSSLKNYRISTELKNVSLKSVLPQLALPERKWFDLLKKIEVYFELSPTNVEQSTTENNCLFHYSSTQLTDNSDKDNIDVLYTLNLLKNEFPDSYKKLEETLKTVGVDKLKDTWSTLLFSNEYLPELLKHLRDISYFSRQSLCGFSVQAINKIKSGLSTENNMYNTFRDWRFSKFGISIHSSSDKRRFTDFTLSKEQNKYQKLIVFDCDKENKRVTDENGIMCTQHEKPDNLSKSQYYRLASIQLYDDLKLTLLYIGLKNKEISFEIEEHCYLVKQTLYKIGTYDKICLLEKQFQNETFAVALVNQFIEIVSDLKKRVTQYRSIDHALDILLYLYDFCSDEAQQLIERCLSEVRATLLQCIDRKKDTSELKGNEALLSILSCYFILTYKNLNTIDEKDVSQILKLRVSIDNDSKLNSFIPSSLYIKTMITLFQLSSKIENIIDKNLKMLNAYVENSSGSWKKDKSMNLYVKDSYAFIPLKGRLFKNDQPLFGLPSQILNNSHYKECFGTRNFPAEISYRKVFGVFGPRVCFYKTKTEESVNIRFTLLMHDKVWIEDENETFISKSYLDKLPKFLLENCNYSENGKKNFYIHWYKDDKIFIKTADKQIIFEIDLNNNEIYSNEHHKFLIPFIKDEFDQSNVLYKIFSRFEDENYVLALKNNQQDSEPVTIYLPRLNLTFKYSGTKILSEDFKDYRLSRDQHISTLLGLSQYLVIELDVESDNTIKFNRKIIIPNHPIERKEPFFSNIIQFNFDKVGRPAYFSYEIDENLKCLNSETTAGSLYLALLYLKTATLDKDLFLEMNGYEACVEILKTCWKNCQYSDTEFNIILKFFENRCPDLEKPWSYYAGSEAEMFSVASHGLNPHHRNTHAIFLRLIYLLLSSYQTDFLIKTDINKKNLYYYLLRNAFVNYHFNFYLIFKNRISKRCRLSREEENKLLSSCVENYSNSRVSDYYNSINDLKELQLSSISPIDYKRVENSCFSKVALEHCKFKEQVMSFLTEQFSRSYYSLNNKNCTVKNLFSNWINIKFEISYFVSLYRIALATEDINNFNKESFSYFLAYLFLSASESDKIFIRILYIVSVVPKEFRSLPTFLLSNKNAIDYDQSYKLNKDSMKLCDSDIPKMHNLDENIRKEVRSSIWTVLGNEYLNRDNQSNFTVNDIVNSEFKLKFQNNFETILKQKNVFHITSHLLDTLYENFLSKSRNKELYEFFIETSCQCEKIVRSPGIGKTTIITTGLSNFKMSLSIDDIKNQINENYFFSETDEICPLVLEWKVESIDINGHYEDLQKLFDVKYHCPEYIPFPLDPKTLPDRSVVRKTFSHGYGKILISDLAESYGQEFPIVKINKKYFFYSIKEPKTSIDLLNGLGYDFNSEFSCLEDSSNEVKNDLFSDVEQWVRSENSRNYIPDNDREKIKNMEIELKNECEKINDELIKRNILSEPLALETLKQLLEGFKTDASLKREAKIWLRNLDDSETKTEDFILENNNLFKLFLNYCREQSFVNPSILKLICKRKKIGISIYEKLDKPIFELKLIENYSYISDECKTKFQIWLNEQTFCQIETKDIEDGKMLEKFTSNSTVTGYLQTSMSEFHLKAEYDINNVTDVLVKYYSEYEKINEQLLEEIRRNISLTTNRSDETDIFILHRMIGEKIDPTRKEILSLLKNIEKIKEYNPFIMNQKYKFYEKIECYLVQQTLIQRITRAILLISKYNSLHPDHDKDERERVLENIVTHILMRRCYDEKVHPSWLLFETENNLLIRDTQYSLVEAMKKEKTNSIYQLNMGEGKTSVILIIFSETLADGEQIVRINCLEPLMGVTQELLRNKFGRLLQKKIYVMPFSREVTFSTENLEKIKEMLTECQHGKHILLVTPEQRLCFQLKKQEMFLEYLQSKDANDFFNWEEHGNRQYPHTNNAENLYALTGSQIISKKVLHLLGYIDNTDRIVKYPSEGFTKFCQEVCEKMSGKIRLNGDDIYSAYRILRDKSTQLKTQRKQHLELLYSIDELKFFDILDESDEILRHGRELNYTLGLSKPLDGGYNRWEIPFILFKIIFSDKCFGEILKNASQKSDCPVVFQENFRPLNGIGGGTPFVRFIKHEYFAEFIRPELCRKICKAIQKRYHEKNTDIIDEKGENHGKYTDFVDGKCLDMKEKRVVELLTTKNQDMLNSFLLAKAWLSHELLYHVMSYRYRIEYGLSEKKEKETAIPFRGKDLPSENSEFSHPDIMIGFTIVSYLYRGLDLKQVKDGLIKLKSDPNENRDNLLQQWIKQNQTWIDEQVQKEKEEFPEWLKSFKTFDLENENRIKKVHLYLSRNFDFIQYYLSNFTFPNDTKYFEKKLTGNAHTLAGEGRTRGFSGTDDRNDTMPESIVPRRLPSQKGTNGKMLHILSRKINSEYQTKMGVSNAINLLDQVCEYAKSNKDCYTLIDAGAMITEMSNFDVSKYFIKKIDKRFEGIVYFSDKSNKIMVILRNEEYLPLSACHIDNKKLFVYLDEVHTRGTDLKLPLTAHGIVTLGKNMNKDKLMQAVMRLRELDFKQSVIFWGSKEISAEIAIINEIVLDKITSKHVLTWITYNTIRKNENDLYLVTKEKLKYVIKSRALKYQKKFKEVPMDSLIIAYISETPDCIKESYGKTPQERNPKDLLSQNMVNYLNRFYPSLKTELKQKRQSLELTEEIDSILNAVDRPKMKRILEKVDDKLPNNIYTVNSDDNYDGENEREVEEMKQVEIAFVKPMTPVVEVPWNFDRIFELNFKEEGLIEANGSPKLKKLNKCFEFTDIDGLKNLRWSNKIFVTENFIKTIVSIDEKNKQYQNDYLKPVNMILIHRKNNEPCFIIVSMFESQYLIDLCHQKKDPDVELIHIDDLNGPTMVPINATKLTKEEIANTVAVIRLFNGDCHYNKEETDVIKKCVAAVKSDCFHEDKAISERIYNELESRHYLTNGFMTSKLASKLADRNEKILFEMEVALKINLQSLFHSIVKESIAEDAENVWKLPELIRQIVRIRGKSEQYQRSTLKEILDKNRD